MPAKEGNTNASHRKKMAREALRLKIDGEKCLEELYRISDALGMVDPPFVSGLKAQADIQFGLLKKILPDLKSVEHSGDPDNPVVTKIELEVVDPKG